MKKRIAIICILLIMPVPLVLAQNIEESSSMTEKLPIIYSDRYNIRFMGIQRIHPFDTEKYNKIYQYLISRCGLDQESFNEPVPVTDEELREVHTVGYLKALESSKTIAFITEIPFLRFVPNSLLSRIILKPMKFATGGTIFGAELALEHGWAINLSGGYHHAKRDMGGGFCFYADIPLAFYKLRKKNPSLRALLIDLDAHQGNGFEDIFGNEEGIFILDVYNKDIYPGDYRAMKHIDMNIPIESNTGDKEYLSIVETSVEKAIIESQPDIIFYNAGTDIFTGDPLGRLDISDQGIIKRDEIIFTSAFKNNIPILMVLSGGYTKKSGEIIGRSIENILRNVVKLQLAE